LFLDFKNWPLPFVGLLLGFILLFLPFALGGIGAGDIKLLMALGAFLGVKAILWITLFMGIAGGFLSIIVIITHHGFNLGLYRVYLIITSIWNHDHRQLAKKFKNNEKIYVPYAVAIFVGLIAVVLWRP
jgi:prepilin peptidase CpaA